MPTTPASSVSLWQLNRELVAALIRNTIETYPPEWRLLQEPLQNAIDAYVLPDGSSFTPQGGPRKVEIELSLGENKVTIRDNGSGIPPERFTRFFYLGEGNKGDLIPQVRRMLKGSQGVGIKSTVFTSRSFHVETVHAGKKWQATLSDFYRFKEPDFPEDVPVPVPTDTQDSSGTTISFQLEDYSVNDFLIDRASEFLSLAGLDNATVDSGGAIVDGDGQKHGPYDWIKVLTYYLKKFSYAGCVSRLLGVGALPQISFTTRVVCDVESSALPRVNGMKPLPARGVLTGSDEVEYVDFKKLVESLPPRERWAVVSDYRTVLETGQQYERPTVFYQLLTASDVRALCGRLRKRRATDPPGAFPNVLEADSEALTRNQTALDRVNGAVLFIASRMYMRSKLAHKASFSLSVNGIPTDIALEVTGAELGYLPAVHFILDVNEPLGYGKRNLPPRSKGLYNQLARDLWKVFHSLASFLVATQEERDRTLVGVPFDKTVELSSIERSDRARLDQLKATLGRVSDPKTEEDVVAAFVFMVATGRFPGYRFVRLSDHTIYDGLVVAPTMNPLTVVERDLLTVEFKRSTKDLCESDLSQRQNFEDIQLGIVWEATPDSDLPAGYSGLYRDADVAFRGYHDGANYRLRGGRNTVQVAVLKDLFESS